MPKREDKNNIGVYFDTPDEALIAKCLFKTIKSKTGENNGKIIIRALNKLNMMYDDKGNLI